MKAVRLSTWLAVFAATSAVAASSSAGAVPLKRHYADAAGDSGAAADIYATTVLYRAGLLTFSVAYRDHPEPLAGAWFAVGLDSDNNVLTGSEGFEYVVTVRAGGEIQFFHWNGEDLSPRRAPASLDAVLDPGVAQISVARAAVGSPVRFSFIVATGAGASDDVDFAPDSGFWSNSLAGRLRSLSARFSRSDRLLTLAPRTYRIGTSTGVPVSPDSISCGALVERRPLRHLRPCSWAVPRWAVSKRIDVSVTVRFGEQRRTFLRRVPEG